MFGVNRPKQTQVIERKPKVDARPPARRLRHYNNQFLLNTWLIKCCITKYYSVQQIGLCFSHIYKPIQSSIMQIWLFSMILNTIQVIILWFSRLSDTSISILNLPNDQEHHNKSCQLEALCTLKIPCYNKIVCIKKHFIYLHPLQHLIINVILLPQCSNKFTAIKI